MIETVAADYYPPPMWPIVSRPRRPYAFERVTITTDFPDDAPEAIKAAQTTERRYLRGPIHPHLLALEPGNGEQFVDWVAELGLREWLGWLADERYGSKAPSAWDPIIGAYEVMQLRHLPAGALVAAWEDPETAERFFTAQHELLELFDTVRQLEGTGEAYEALLEQGFWTSNPFRVRFYVSRSPSGRPQAFETPIHIFARAAFEVLDGLTEQGHFPKTCAFCGQPFIPTRQGQRYCPGTDHQMRGAEKRRQSDPRRREYHRLYQRMKRAKTEVEREDAEAAIERWKRSQGHR